MTSLSSWLGRVGPWALLPVLACSSPSPSSDATAATAAAVAMAPPLAPARPALDATRPIGAPATVTPPGGLPVPSPGTPAATLASPGTPAAAPASPPLPAALRLALLQSHQAEATAAHRVEPGPDGLRAHIAEAHLRARFDDRGATLTSDLDPALHARLTLASVGRQGGPRQPVQAARPTAHDHTVTWEHRVGGARAEESWQAGPLGLEHRVVVRQRPAGQGPVELEVAVEGLRPQADGERVRLASPDGAPGLAMRDYFVRDARGKLLAGEMSVRGGQVVYRYEDEGAVYPVEIDPLVATQQAKLLATDKATNDVFGQSVALSSDGNTALVGAYIEGDSGTTSNGAAYVFVRAGDVWSQQQKLLASDKSNNDFFGQSVALSSDGNTALVGAYREGDSGTTQNGAAYVFVRSSGAWLQQQKLLASDKASNDQFGQSVALSSDGNTALVGAHFKNDAATTQSGAAYVFVRAGDVWSQQQKFLASDKSNNDWFGFSVALSSDGNTALVGAYQEDDSGTTGNGAAYVFVRAGDVWSQQQKLLGAVVRPSIVGLVQ